MSLRPPAPLRIVLLVPIVALLAVACGGDDPAVAPPADPTNTATAPPEGTGGGLITIGDLGRRCDELTDIVVELRGEEPASVQPSGTPPEPSGVFVGDKVGYQTIGCVYVYEGDEFPRSQNRVTLSLDRAVDDGPSEEVLEAMFYGLAGDEVGGLGDAALFYSGPAAQGSVLHVLVGHSVLRVRVSAPMDADFLPEDNVVPAGRAFRERVSL